MSSSTAPFALLDAADGWGWISLQVPGPTAAFSRRDSLAMGYPEAAAAARAHGFEPVIRSVGGRLAAYHDGALLVDVVARHADPRLGITARFRHFGEAVAAALVTLGVDARLGPVPGEYCYGAFSVNAGGRAKLAGTAQRLRRNAVLFSAVVLVANPEPVRAVLSEAYPLLGLTWDPRTVGSVSDHRRDVTTEEVADALGTELAKVLPVAGPISPWTVGRLVPLQDCWEAS
jgi:lipoate-protein ligase A